MLKTTHSDNKETDRYSEETERLRIYKINRVKKGKIFFFLSCGSFNCIFMNSRGNRYLTCNFNEIKGKLREQILKKTRK